MEIRYHGHSCFELSEGDARVLIDPFLKPNNPTAVATADEVEPTQILVTHGHVDHMADAVGVAKRTGVAIAAQVEIANWFQARDLENVSDPNLGGTVEFEGGWAKLVQAFHTSTLPGSNEVPFSAEHGTPVGQAAGWVVNLGGVTVYHAGDTCLFGDMQLIARSTPIDIALLPIGGHYTMDRHDAVIAAELTGAKTVIPMHYDTFPPIETDAGAFQSDVEARLDAKVVVLDPGEAHEA
ncbi:MAG: metal-dependent hydrolase [Solirubrobacterales bacterium]|jgi:L-ascorbate metabolism protein UlaG (beta-lactamase superfamily)